MSKDKLPEKLLAKSRLKNGEEVSLEKHLLDTEQAAQQIFRLNGRWGKNWCRFFQIQTKEAQECFLLSLRVAALFHDIGKANEDFYAAVSKEGFTLQTLRHEHISALLLCLPEVRAWLSTNSVLDVDIITAAVLSHHIKASEKKDEFGWCQPRGKSILKLYLQHDEIKAILQRIGNIANLGEPPNLKLNVWSEGNPWSQTWRDGIRNARKLAREIRNDRQRLGLLLATKAGVIVADAAASGLVREGHSISNWIEEKVHADAIGINDITEAVINPRGKQIFEKTGKPFDFHPFQTQVAERGSRVLLLAACAAGKTLAAWKWAEEQAKRYQIGKVIFLYPTRGTATEGFRDYVGWAPEGEGAYVAGDSHYVLEGMAANPSESTAGKRVQLSEAEERLFALGLWSRRYFSATVDQFLSFIEHSYTSLCLLPLLADSAIIIDEVHSFDKRMFYNLISFLKTFDVPVLCMTATLPPQRRTDLLDAGLKLFPTKEDTNSLEDLDKKEKHPRYKLEPLKDESEALAKAIEAYLRGERVLWVVNTVGRCQRIANNLEKVLKRTILTYHSRFRLCDRQQIHNDTVAAFQQVEMPAIAVTTQVCEMSLDLDADVLISEVAPISSLVQRFGRANRHLAKGDKFRARLHIYEPENVLPYTAEEIKAAKAFLDGLGAGDVSQREMAEELEKNSLPQPKADDSARFLYSGYFATPGVFRDIDEFTHPCILDDDLAEVKTLLDTKKSFDGLVVGIPRKFVRDERPDWLPKYLGVASKKLYSENKGFLTEIIYGEEKEC